MPTIGATECLDAETAARYTHRLVNQRAVVGTVTKGHFTMAAGAAEVIADRAVALATSGRPGPVHIDPSLNIADAPAEAEPALRRRPSMPVATVGGARLADLVE